MLIEVAADANITKRCAEGIAGDALQRNSLIDDAAVSRRPLQRLKECLRGREDVIEQADLAKIDRLGELKSQHIVVQRFSDEIYKPDLIMHLDATCRVFDMLPGQTDFA